MEDFELRVKQYRPHLQASIEQILRSVERLQTTQDQHTRQQNFDVIRQAALEIRQRLQNDQRLQNRY